MPHNLKNSMNTASNGILILVYQIKIVQYQTPSSYDQPPPMVQTQIDLQQGCLIKVYNLGWFSVKTNDNKLQRSWDKKKNLNALCLSYHSLRIQHETRI